MDSSEKDISADELTVKYQWTIANRLSSTCPAVSRFYLSNLEKRLIDDPKLLKKDIKRSFLFCNHCGSLWSPDNHKVRVCAPPSPNKHLQKLLKYDAEQPWRMNCRQKKKLKKFKDTTSKIVYICNTCKKTTTFPGNKKYGRNDRNGSFATPVPKIISKKGDLNAGLFIKTPNDILMKEPQDKINLPAQPQSETQTLSTTEIKSTIRIVNKPIMQRKLQMNNAVSSNKKNKKSLLTQILNQEQESKKKKNNLSSFLVSL